MASLYRLNYVVLVNEASVHLPCSKQLIPEIRLFWLEINGHTTITEKTTIAKERGLDPCIPYRTSNREGNKTEHECFLLLNERHLQQQRLHAPLLSTALSIPAILEES